MTRKQLEEQYRAEIAVNPEGWRNWQFMNIHGWVGALNLKMIDFSSSYKYRRNPDAAAFVAARPKPLRKP